MTSSKPSGWGSPCEPWRVLMYCTKNSCWWLSHLAAGRMVLADPFGRSRVLLQRPRRPRRTLHEVTAAIRAEAAQASSGTVGAEGAFIGADQRVRRAVRQVLVAAFAVRAEIEHGFLLRPQV